MNAIVVLNPRMQAQPVFDTPVDDRRIPVPMAANLGPEAPMSVSFVGLAPADQLKALASFPGARRCSISAA